MGKEKAVEKKSDNVFVEFYNPETKIKKVFTIDVKDVDKIVLKQSYDKDKDRHTVHLELPGKSINFTPRLDKLGRLSTYISKAQTAEVVEKL